VRKLKLQVQMTVDGFMAGPEGQLDWMSAPGDERNKFVNALTDSCDTILMGSGMAPGFIQYWESVGPDDRALFDFARKMVDLPKVVFSRTLDHLDGKNVRVESGDLVTAVNALKAMPGKDMIVYGGATFDGALVEHGLIDELNLFVNPVAIGNGMRMFTARTPLQLAGSQVFEGGVVVNTYTPEAA
jgi:dihydrofolate reductase